MALGYADCNVAGVSLEDSNGNKCKVLIIDAGNFRATVTGNNVAAADGTIYTQTLTPVGGLSFGLRIEFIPPDVLNDVIEAINAAVGGGDSFNVSAQDDITSIESDCVPDFAAGWLKIEPQRTNEQTVKGVEMRFVTVG